MVVVGQVGSCQHRYGPIPFAGRYAGTDMVRLPGTPGTCFLLADPIQILGTLINDYPSEEAKFDHTNLSVGGQEGMIKSLTLSRLTNRKHVNRSVIFFSRLSTSDDSSKGNSGGLRALPEPAPPPPQKKTQMHPTHVHVRGSALLAHAFCRAKEGRCLCPGPGCTRPQARVWDTIFGGTSTQRTMYCGRYRGCLPELGTARMVRLQISIAKTATRLTGDCPWLLPTVRAQRLTCCERHSAFQFLSVYP